MERGRAYAACFLSALPANRGSVETSGLEELLTTLVDAATTAWPDFEYQSDLFVTDVAARLPVDAGIANHVGALAAGDLYLAYACARGETRAIVAFEAQCLPVVGPALAKLGASADAIDEVKQALRERFLVGRADKAPAIAGYQGLGSLVAWVRVSAIREYYGVVAKQQRHGHADDDLELVDHSPAGNPEMGFLKREYREDFREALAVALATLSPKQRTILRQHYLDGLQVDQLARLYKVHRVTLSRWLAKTREAVIVETRRALMDRLQVDRAEFESILRLIRSQLDVSLRAHLGTRSGATKTRTEIE